MFFCICSFEDEEPVAWCGEESRSEFAQCRQLAAQLGVLAPARRNQAHLLRRTDRLLRELRNLDAHR